MVWTQQKSSVYVCWLRCGAGFKSVREKSQENFGAKVVRIYSVELVRRGGAGEDLKDWGRAAPHYPGHRLEGARGECYSRPIRYHRPSANFWGTSRLQTRAPRPQLFHILTRRELTIPSLLQLAFSTRTGRAYMSAWPSRPGGGFPSGNGQVEHLRRSHLRAFFVGRRRPTKFFDDLGDPEARGSAPAAAARRDDLGVIFPRRKSCPPGPCGAAGHIFPAISAPCRARTRPCHKLPTGSVTCAPPLRPRERTRARWAASARIAHHRRPHHANRYGSTPLSTRLRLRAAPPAPLPAAAHPRRLPPFDLSPHHSSPVRRCSSPAPSMRRRARGGGLPTRRARRCGAARPRGDRPAGRLHRLRAAGTAELRRRAAPRAAGGARGRVALGARARPRHPPPPGSGSPRPPWCCCVCGCARGLPGSGNSPTIT